jgi:cytochrome c553
LTILALTSIAATAGFAAHAATGKTAFDKSCKSCHGADGTPNPTVSQNPRALPQKNVRKLEAEKASRAFGNCLIS